MEITLGVGSTCNGYFQFPEIAEEHNLPTNTTKDGGQGLRSRLPWVSLYVMIIINDRRFGGGSGFNRDG